MTEPLYWMEVRDADDAENLLGWLAVPEKVSIGRAGGYHTFRQRRRPSDAFVVTLTLPINRYKAPGGADWLAFSADGSAKLELPVIHGFRKA